MSFEFTDELKKKVERVDELSRMSLVYGVVDEEKTYPNGEFVYKVGIYNEYGTNDIPSRPFFRSFQWNKGNILKELCKKMFNSCVKGDIKPIDAYKRVGRYCKSAITDSLLNGSWQPNAPSTVKLKGSDRPLVDTGNLLNCIGFVIYKDDVEIYKEVGSA